MLSSAARRLAIASARRQGGAAARTPQGRLLASTSRRCFVALAQQPRTLARADVDVDGPAQPPIIVPLCAPESHPQRRWMSGGDLPYHIVVGMPALSPTMESGTISKWNVAEGDSFSAGDSLAVIETDKATIDFEAQDDGVVAKLLVSEGGGELKVGLPIMVTVEDAGDVGAFANFSPSGAAAGGGEAAAPAAVAEAPAAPTAPAAPAKDLPYHIVVGMPALSPTMDSGTISKWNVSAGESFAAGDSLAVIETDKATIDFEAQDDGVVAKLLVDAGSGEVAVGVPIMVTVEDEGDVGAFADFVAGTAPASAATEASAPAPAAEEVKAEPVAKAAAAPAAAPAPVRAPAAAAAKPEPAAKPAAPPGAVSLGGSAWGRLAAEKSPLARALASKQKQYVERYGSTGHVPIV